MLQLGPPLHKHLINTTGLHSFSNCPFEVKKQWQPLKKLNIHVHKLGSSRHTLFTLVPSNALIDKHVSFFIIIRSILKLLKLWLFTIIRLGFFSRRYLFAILLLKNISTPQTWCLKTAGWFARKWKCSFRNNLRIKLMRHLDYFLHMWQLQFGNLPRFKDEHHVLICLQN